MKNLRWVSLISMGIFLTACTSSGTTDNDSTTAAHQYLTIPNAVFVSGTPTGAAGSLFQKPAVTAPQNTTYTINETITWTVDFSMVIEVEVTDILIEVDELNGYFVYPLEPDEIAAGSVEVVTELVDEEPASDQICNRDFRGNGTCYSKADTGVTGLDFSAANYDEAQAAFSWTAYEEETATINAVVGGDDSGDDDGGGDDGGDGSYSGDTVCSAWQTMCSCRFRACSDGSNSWYDVGNGVYYCASASNCTSAAEQAATYCTRGC